MHRQENSAATVAPSVPKRAYQTPCLITHGSVAKLTQHDSTGGASDLHSDVWIPEHKHRHWYQWW